MVPGSNRRRSSTPRARSTRFRLPLRRLIAGAFLLAAGSAVALPTAFSARYEVTHSGFTLGEALIQYQQLGEERYRYSSLTRPVGITKLFYNAQIKEVSEGRITEDGYQPDRYHYDRSGRKDREALLLFDWDKGRVVNEVGGDPWAMDIPKDALDRMVSQLQLMHDLADREADLTYRIADGGKLREYTLNIVGREELATPYGRLETVKVSRRDKDGKRETTFWCAPALDYLAVRIDHREKGDNYSMTLEDVDGFAVARKRAVAEEPVYEAGVVPRPPR